MIQVDFRNFLYRFLLQVPPKLQCVLESNHYNSSQAPLQVEIGTFALEAGLTKKRSEEKSLLLSNQNF